MLIEQLHEETDDCARNMSDVGNQPIKASSSRYKSKDFGYKDDGRYFAKYPRLRFLINLINISIQKDLYDIAYEVIKLSLIHI